MLNPDIHRSIDVVTESAVIILRILVVCIGDWTAGSFRLHGESICDASARFLLGDVARQNQLRQLTKFPC